MNKYYFITALAITLTIYLQGSYISNSFNEYVINKSQAADEALYSSIYLELHIRSLDRKKAKNKSTDGKTYIKSIKDMSRQELDSILKIKPLPKSPIESRYNVLELIESDIIRSAGDMHSQINQDQYFNEGWHLNLQVLDSVFINAVGDDFPHHFIKYDKEMKIVEQFGDTTLTNYNYASKTHQIGLEGLQYIELKADILMSEFIKGSIRSLALSAAILFFILAFMVHQLITIRRKTEQIEHSEKSVNGIIHDLKSPLVSVFTMLDLFHITEKEPRRKDLVSKNMTSIENMIQNVESLLSVVRMNRRKLVLNKTNFGAKELISAIDIIKNDLSMSYNNKSHTIIVESKLSCNTVIYADKMYLENVVRNLVENALKYSNDEVIITLTLDKKLDKLCVSVKDNGWGIAKKYQRKLFKEFYQVPREGRKIDGYGIGLSHVKHIITGHKGRIFVESEKNVGSLFTFLIPLS